MRIVLDLQGAQSDSRFRGIGRYSLAFSQAVARVAGRHEIWLALSGRFPDSIEPLRVAFSGLVPPERIRVFELPGPVAEFNSANVWRMQAAELIREKFLADLRPDIVHVSTLFEGYRNEVVASVGRLDPTVPTAVTLYDLIPLLRPQSYLTDPTRERCYLRRVQSLKRADLLLAISESSRREALGLLGISPERIITIGAGLPLGFQPAEISPAAQNALMKRCGLQRPFVLYTGGSEPRKNLKGLLAAFGLLPEDLRASYQLAVTGRFEEGQRLRLLELAREQGLVNGEVVCCGYVSDDDLRMLYSCCALFVLPSLHEGFGLPLLEAMACGAAVIGAKCTSIPEIIDREDALFDPERPGEISRRIKEVLSNDDLRRSLKIWGKERVGKFTWKSSAHKALDGFESLHAERKAAASAVASPLGAQDRPLLAFIAPLPPEQSGIPGFPSQLLPFLARYYEITCIIDQPEVTDPWITAEFPMRDTRWFQSNAARFDRMLYVIGNSPAHKHMFELLERHPGVVLLSDFNLGGLFQWMENSGYAPGSFTMALYGSHGFSALRNDQVTGREASIATYPCNAAVLRLSVGLIVQRDDAIEQIRAWYGDTKPLLIRQLPFPARSTCIKEGEAVHGQPEPAISPARSQAAEGRHTDHPEQVAALYRDTLEEFYAASSCAREQSLVASIIRIPAEREPGDADLRAVAQAMALNREPLGLRQLLVDVTILAKYDARTGIQRVTRAILMALIADPPPGYRIEPVRAVAGGYLYARRFTSSCLGLTGEHLADDPVEPGPADIFLGLDWGADVVPSMKPWFEARRRHRTQIIFLAYDLLPVARPEFFPPAMSAVANEWIKTVADVADGVVCISRMITDEFCEWLGKVAPRRLQPLSLGFFHLGADLHASLPTTGLSTDTAAILAKLRSRSSFLMVGTLEPRKGHRQAIAAMELLWAEGLDLNLVIIGKRGWMTDHLEQRIRKHPEYDRRLFWLEGVSDEMLEEVYRLSLIHI